MHKFRYYWEEPEIRNVISITTKFSHVKKWLLLLLLKVFHYSDKYRGEILTGERESSDLGIKALQMMWWSLPEPYLTLSEVQCGVHWRPDLDQLQPTAGEVYTFYENKVMDGKYQVLDVKEPRSLKHLTRCNIRSRLALNCALPGGIQHLALAPKLREFLSLLE